MQIKLYGSVIGLAALFAPISATQTPFNASVCLPTCQPYQSIQPANPHFQFDNLQGSASARIDPVGIYYGISYNNFGVSQPGVANESLSGVIPHSDPNFAAGFVSGASSLSIAYAGSNIKSFALDNFYYGCATALLQGEIEAAVNCSITVTGYKAGSTEPAATQTFGFTPDEPVDFMNALAFGTFDSGFQGLEYANFTFRPSTLVVVLVDNVVGYTQS